MPIVGSKNIQFILKIYSILFFFGLVQLDSVYKSVCSHLVKTQSFKWPMKLVRVFNISSQTDLAECLRYKDIGTMPLYQGC